MNLKTLVAAGGLLVMSQVGHAQGTGFFVEGTVGTAKADLGNTAGLTVDDRDTTFSIAGGYMFNDYVGAEVSYRNLGEAKASTAAAVSGTYYGTPFTAAGTFRASAEATGWTLGPRVNIPINDKLSFNARLGWLRWDVDAKASASGSLTYGGATYAGSVQASASNSGTDTFYGLGAAYTFQKKAALGLNYNRFKLKDVDVDTWDVSVRVSF